jgi:hypothetical protein
MAVNRSNVLKFQDSARREYPPARSSDTDCALDVTVSAPLRGQEVVMDRRERASCDPGNAGYCSAVTSRRLSREHVQRTIDISMNRRSSALCRRVLEHCTVPTRRHHPNFMRRDAEHRHEALRRQRHRGHHTRPCNGASAVAAQSELRLPTGPSISLACMQGVGSRI